jgi:hypothetical protein
MLSHQVDKSSAAHSQKAIAELLCAHNAIIRAWYEDWIREQTARVNSAFDARESATQKEPHPLHP